MMSFTKFAQEKDAASFRDAFLEKIQSAVADEIEQQKIAVSQSMFNSQVEEDAVEEEEEVDALAEEVEQIDESGWLRYKGSVNDKEYVIHVPRNKDLGDYSAKSLHNKIAKENEHLAHHEVKAIVDSEGAKSSTVNVEHGGKKYSHHVYNDQHPKHVYEEVEQIDEVSPPGREKQVKALKKTGVRNPWAVAWASYNKSKKK